MPHRILAAAPGAAGISRSTVTAVRRSVRDSRVLEHRVGRAAPTIAADAHRLGAQRMLVGGTGGCARLSSARRAVDGGDVGDLARRPVTLRIHESHQARRTHRRATASAPYQT